MSDHDDTTSVEYRDIPEFPGYRVGDDGSAWSSRYRIQGGWNIGGPWWQMKPVLNGEGVYRGVFRKGRYRVTLCRDGQHYARQIHHLVLYAFVGPRPQGMEACHYDDDYTNNRLSNLRWDTKQKNMEDRRRNGGNCPGERNGDSRLKETDIPEIFRLARQGMYQRDIAKIYGVTHTAIGYILRRKLWKHVAV